MFEEKGEYCRQHRKASYEHKLKLKMVNYFLANLKDTKLTVHPCDALRGSPCFFHFM